MPQSQGGTAVANGKAFEATIEGTLRARGFELIQESQQNKYPNVIATNRYVLKNVKFNSVYHHVGKTEFVIVSGTRRIRIEVKYQAAAGSVDEKFVYMLLNAIQAYPEKEVILIVDGGGYKAGARQWIQEMIDNNWLNYQNTKTIKLMTGVEFINWFNHESL